MQCFKILLPSNYKFPYAGALWLRFLILFLTLCAHLSLCYGHAIPSSSGKSKRSIVPLIYNGMQADHGKWPWHATLFSVFENSYFCGGTIVDSSTILTAAHCFVYQTTGDYRVASKSNILVRGGVKYVDASTPGVQESNLAQIIVHPDYNQSTLANDIAILKSLDDFNTTTFVQPVPIWSAEKDENLIIGINGTIIGFGLNKYDEISDTLQLASLTVLDRKTCVEYDPKTYGRHLTSSMYCAGGKNNVSACNGDSGGGMFFNIDETWYLRGIVSFSPSRPNVKIPVCDPTKPTVFTDVWKYSKWIARYTNTTKWLKELKPCEKDIILDKDTECNAASRFDYGYLFLGMDHSITRVPVNGEKPFHVREDIRPLGVDYDCVEGRLYWSDSITRSIFSVKYDGTDEKPLVTKDLEIPQHVAVDWISRRLYWVDYEKETVEVASLENPNLRTTVTTNVVDYDRIAVDPVQGKLYRIHQYVGIEWSNLDGSEAEILLHTPRVKEIKVSIVTGELCYEEPNKIACIDTRSKRIRTIVSNLTEPFALALTDKMVYWMERNRSTIESIDHHGMRQQSIQYNKTSIVKSLNAVSDMCPVFHSPCAINNGNCPNNTICLLHPRAQFGKICKSTSSKFVDQIDPSTIIKTKSFPNIHNSMKANQMKWPWHAAIYRRLNNKIAYLCGGSIVDGNTILTAAHSLYHNTSKGFRVLRENELSVRAGSKYLDGITDVTQVLHVAQIIIHPEYNHSSLANNIAIVKLSSHFDITNVVRPVPIWSAGSDQDQNGTVIGFGLNENGEPYDLLREASVTVLDAKTCLGYDNVTYETLLMYNMYCGRSNSDSACLGDRAGGMVLDVNGTWYLRGVVSFSPVKPNTTVAVCDNSKPAVFTDVTKYRNWVLQYTNTTKWLKDLKPCKDSMVDNETDCNAQNPFDDGFLIARAGNNIIRMPVNGEPAFVVQEDTSLNDRGGIDYDCVEGRFYWVESGTRTIFSAKHDGTDKKSFITKDIDPGHVAVDWISRHLYWVDYGKKTIEVASLENPDLRTTVRTNVVYFNRIAVDPLQGKLYRSRRIHGISLSNLDGSESERLLDANAVPISDIKVSMATGELCYVVECNFKIECIDTRSKRIRTIVSNLTNPDKLAVTDDLFFWSEDNSGLIEGIDRYGARQTPIRYNNTDNIISLNSVTSMCPRFYSPCAINNGNCPEHTICLLNPRAQGGKVCKCTKNCNDTNLES